MISAELVDDAFWCWSVPPATLHGRLPQDVTPVLCEGRAWMAVAAARLVGMRVAGVSLPRPVVAVVTLAVVSWPTADGRRLVGNYFLDALTDSRLVACGDRCFGAGLFRLGGVLFARTQGGLRLVIPGVADLWLAQGGAADPAASGRLAQVFAGNQRGVIRRGGRLLASGLTKDHWRMDARPARIARTPRALGAQARFECGFDASGVHARWQRLRPLATAR